MKRTTEEDSPREPIRCHCLLCRFADRLRTWCRGDDTRIARQVGHAQPLPTSLVVCQIPASQGGPQTAIARGWAEGDAGRCRLCPRDRCCVSDGGVCLVVVPRYVPTRDTALYAYGSPQERGLA